MADDGYHLYIHFGDVAENSSMAGGGETAGKSESDNTAKGIQSAARKIVSYSAVKSTADQVISGRLNSVELSTGAKEYEERLNAGYNIGKQIWNAGEAILIGAATGGLAGAIAGLAISGVHSLISYQQRRATLAREEALENVSINLMNIRAGTDGRRGRTQ